VLSRGEELLRAIARGAGGGEGYSAVYAGGLSWALLFATEAKRKSLNVSKRLEADFRAALKQSLA
jgi:hypothetical protein